MRYIGLILLLLVLQSLGCKNKEETKEEGSSQASEVKELDIISLSDAQMKNANVELGGIEQRTISSTIKVFGKVDVPPQNLVSVSMPLGGYLKSTKLLPGMHIAKGEIIASMEDQQYIQLQQDYLTTKAQMISLEKAYDRQVKLNENKAGSDKALQEAEAAYKSARITLRSLEERLHLININAGKLEEATISRSIPVLSPINGFVSKVNVNVGKYINATEVLFELVNPDDIHLNLTVFEKDLDKLTIGQKVVAFNNSHPEKKYEGDIILISKNLDSAHTAEVHCHFDNYDHTLMPGMYMNAQISLNLTQASVVPSDAVVMKGEKNYVFVHQQQNIFQLIPVDAGETDNGYTQIKNDQMLEEKEIVIKGAYAILMEISKGEDNEEVE
ncbi:efflux RND transporter periplasmic adaptor subunit [Olivibacter sp. SDN3]|uniref:efflux RND transporter periplasmic adaptor subunit n=1 Tax=Olivibacter sp. SDN3 TaxID=2764720 RepID=UPI0016510B17|nr:efflux RND transporter periplasmic adaptor subunit [Olivibacter sp. SDN3]QNL49911.1 efflux RND transporter periplasmic adaptor subunit [Olivibacter sp. SDN3]